MRDFSRYLVAAVLSGSSLFALAQAPVVDVSAAANNAPSEQQNNIESELYQQIQTLRQEMMNLRGTVEEQGHQLRQVKQQSLERYIDLDRRVAGAAGAPAATPVAVPAVRSAVTVVPAEPIVPSVSVGATVGQVVAPIPAPVAVVSKAAVGNASSDYAKAYSLVKVRDFPAAITEFSAYVERYPEGRYTPNAWYWLGELYLAAKPQNTEAATAAFQRLLSDYPNHSKVPAAMYKLGTVYFLAGEKERAQQMLTHVIDRYSNTGNSAVNKAREFLRDNY